MGGFIIALIVVAVLAVFVLGVWALVYGYRAAEQRDRRVLIEREMRQDIIDARSRKRAAAKILHEAGEKP